VAKGAAATNDEPVTDPRLDWRRNDGEAWRRPAYIVVGILIAIILAVVLVWAIAASVIPNT
jgi:hypothetical protein